MQELAARRTRIAHARADFLRTGREGDGVDSPDVSDVVSASWQRSLSAGVDPSFSHAVYHDDLDLYGRLVRCAEPVIARLGQETADWPMSVVLCDSKARILSRSENDRSIGVMLDRVSLAPGFNYGEESVGTNGIGTVFESGKPLFIVGAEHFHEELQAFACAGSPIRDPLTGRVEGVLDISCLSEYSSPLMHSLVRSAARDIEHNLLLDRSRCQQALFEAFVRQDARKRGAVMAVGGTVAMSNAVAQMLFNPAEQWTIQEHARYLMIGQAHPVDTIELASGKVVQLRGTRITAGNDSAGIIVAVTLVSERATERATERDRPPIVIIPLDGGVATPVRRETAPMESIISPLLKRALVGISAALTANLPLLIMGENGCGKLTAAQDVFTRLSPGGQCLVFDSGPGILPRLRAVKAHLRESVVRTLFVFTNIDRLDGDGVEDVKKCLLAIAAKDGMTPVAATASDANLLSQDTFRELLTQFDRAATVPPIRHRIEDLPGVVLRILSTLGPVSGHRQARLTASALRMVASYSWPGNIRQLRDALEAALAIRPVGDIQAEDLPSFVRHGAQRALSTLESIERDMIVAALADADGNRVHAATALGIARSSLYRKLKAYGIDET
ncbi:helix-turn-helix domain-containing protein [Alpinimonas psychrophila]